MVVLIFGANALAVSSVGGFSGMAMLFKPARSLSLKSPMFFVQIHALLGVEPDHSFTSAQR